MNPKKVLTLLFTFAFLIGMLTFSILQGRQRNIYPAERMAKFIPIPQLFGNYMGGFAWLEGDRVKVTWRHRDIHPDRTRDYFLCLGRFRGLDKHYYLLEMDGRHYVEKADVVEPLIHALLALSRGNDPENHEATIEATIAALPDDPQQLIALVGDFKK